MTPLLDQRLSTFRLDAHFIENYKNQTPPFGFSGLGELVYRRTYSRIKDDGTNEAWWETVRRVVEGTYRMQQRWVVSNGLPWDDAKAQRSAQEMYARIFDMKFLPPGRGLWAMGSALTEERGLFSALNNCAFISTGTLRTDLADPFCYLMDASMLGIGVGFDTKGAGQVVLQDPEVLTPEPYKIPDTREGWVEALRRILMSYFGAHTRPVFDYSEIRPEGAPIKGFGGVAAGPGPLRDMMTHITTALQPQVGQPISSRNIVDVMNVIGKCVVSGNVRRSAEIAFGEPDDLDYLDLKDYTKNPEREKFGWASNNSVFAELGTDYSPIAERIVNNGEPGLAWLENMRAYSRMGDAPDYKDLQVMGTNPCYRGDTLIAVADGRGAVPIRSLAYKGEDVPVYSVSAEGHVEIRWARNPRKTRTNAELIEVTLDDGTSLTVTPDHRMLLLDGSWKYARDLQTGDSFSSYSRKSVEEEQRLLAAFNAQEPTLSAVPWFGRILARKSCELCGTEFVVEWCDRHVVYCGRACMLKHQERMEARKAGHHFSQQQLTEYHRHVVSVVPLDFADDVYDLTVDENHTVGIVTHYNPDTKEATGIFSSNCSEQSLESGELCCLVETFPANHSSLADFKRTLKFAYLYAKTVTLGNTPWPKTNAVLLRNRRIGLSQSGVVQAIERLGIDEYRRWCEEGYATVQYYDEKYSNWLAIPKSIKTTSVKPSGTVSLLAGATPGVHYPESPYYIRRVRLATTSALLPALRAANYPIEPAFGSEDTTVVIEIPVFAGSGLRSVRDVSVWEQLELAAFMQRYWADNQVSCTVSFDPATEGKDVANALEFYQYRLKSISFLPRLSEGAYRQMPYESITQQEYQRRVAELKPINFDQAVEQAEAERFCDSDACTI